MRQWQSLRIPILYIMLGEFGGELTWRNNAKRALSKHECPAYKPIPGWRWSFHVRLLPLLLLGQYGVAVKCAMVRDERHSLKPACCVQEQLVNRSFDQSLSARRPPASASGSVSHQPRPARRLHRGGGCSAATAHCWRRRVAQAWSTVTVVARPSWMPQTIASSCHC